MFSRQSERLACCINIFLASFSVSFECPFHLRDTLADERVRDDELRFPVVASFCHVEGVEELLHVISLDLLHIEAVSFHTFASIFALRFLRCSVERDSI